MLTPNLYRLPARDWPIRGFSILDRWEAEKRGVLILHFFFCIHYCNNRLAFKSTYCINIFAQTMAN